MLQFSYKQLQIGYRPQSSYTHFALLSSIYIKAPETDILRTGKVGDLPSFGQTKAASDFTKPGGKNDIFLTYRLKTYKIFFNDIIIWKFVASF